MVAIDGSLEQAVTRWVESSSATDIEVSSSILNELVTGVAETCHNSEETNRALMTAKAWLATKAETQTTAAKVALAAVSALDQHAAALVARGCAIGVLMHAERSCDSEGTSNSGKACFELVLSTLDITLGLTPLAARRYVSLLSAPRPKRILNRSYQHKYTRRIIHSAQGFSILPLFLRKNEHNAIEELVRLHVWETDDGVRTRPMPLAVHSHQPFAQVLILSRRHKPRRSQCGPILKPSRHTPHATATRAGCWQVAY